MMLLSFGARFGVLISVAVGKFILGVYLKLVSTHGIIVPVLLLT